MGTVIAEADASGATTANLKYDGFGNITSSSGSSAAIPSSLGADFRYHGMLLDSATGLYYVRARYYDGQTGRWVSRDRVEGRTRIPESYHSHSFAFSNSLLFRDPSGLAGLEEFGAIELSASFLSLKAEGSYVAARLQRRGKIIIDKSDENLILYDELGGQKFVSTDIVIGCPGNTTKFGSTPNGTYVAGDWQVNKVTPEYPTPWNEDVWGNPYGPFFLPINDTNGKYTTIGIHGTRGPAWNPWAAIPGTGLLPDSTYLACSHGCIRLSNPDIIALHQGLPQSRGTSIIIQD